MIRFNKILKRRGSVKAFDINDLSDSERELFERFKNIRSAPISQIAYGLLGEGHRVFSDDVFLIMCDDVLNMLYISELDRESLVKMIYFAHGVYVNKFYESHEFPDTPMQCIIMLWITFFTEYKSYGRIYKYHKGIDDIGKAQFNTYYSLCENYLNMPSPSKNAKCEAFANLVSRMLGEDPFCRNSDPALVFTTLITLLDMNDLTYSPHEKIMIR